MSMINLKLKQFRYPGVAVECLQPLKGKDALFLITLGINLYELSVEALTNQAN